MTSVDGVEGYGRRQPSEYILFKLLFSWNCIRCKGIRFNLLLLVGSQERVPEKADHSTFCRLRFTCIFGFIGKSGMSGKIASQQRESLIAGA